MKSTYGQRLEQALTTSGKDRQQLADDIGISVQAVSQVLLGKTKALTAENSARAAKFLGVDSFWLATGAGSLASTKEEADQTWPFSVSREEYEQLSSAQKSGLDRIVSEYTRASLERKDEWGTPRQEGLISSGKRKTHSG
ncbi:helix-turn-helix domain-containing protein [Cupriavidus sp. D39]|uniref:helix-turn-helix domain-containing protein n=1 Tax=Cupriavidus sp. D39 TaxID=2997877 RepID=UPI00227058B6|nr:helix-turn-helix transcriptional regulator [Cupriavidus sp. D39]MCY0854299.1 helix-turn-helix transcriptional regulator [Cupriavidus sp. D39]